MIYQWADCDRSFISRRYDRLAGFVPLFDRLLFLPPNLRKKAVAHLELRPGDSVLDVGCGVGANLRDLRAAVGPAGHIYGVDISPGMLRRARKLCEANHWHNVELSECDVADYCAPRPLDGVLISLTYNTIPRHRGVLRSVWRQLRPGGRLVIMDGKLPPGLGGRLLVPFSLWLMKHTLLSNPLIQPWKELAAIAEQFDMREYLFGSYYICRGVKPLADARAPGAVGAAAAEAADVEPELRIAAE